MNNNYKYIFRAILLFIILVTVYFSNNIVSSHNHKIYNRFSKLEIISIDGEINLSELKSKKEELESELFSNTDNQIENHNKIEEINNKLDDLYNNNEKLNIEINSLKLLTDGPLLGYNVKMQGIS